MGEWPTLRGWEHIVTVSFIFQLLRDLVPVQSRLSVFEGIDLGLK